MGYAPGTVVACKYRGGRESAPMRGVVLALTDPRAWADTIAFPTPDPDPVAVACHVARLESLGKLPELAQPVMWEFGTAHWDTQLMPYQRAADEWYQRERAQGHRSIWARLTAPRAGVA